MARGYHAFWWFIILSCLGLINLRKELFVIMKQSISFYTLGCRLNQSETASIQNSFEAGGYEVVDFDKPSDIVDVRTMKPPTNKKDFMPARYAMITGDPRLSPNNDFEVKGLTNDDNKDGNKVKVILISKAGSEGIDFKFIRQIHILQCILYYIFSQYFILIQFYFYSNLLKSTPVIIIERRNQYII